MVTPLLRDQELDLAVRYWEGAVRVQGAAGGRALQGSGYVEPVGYAAAAGGAAGVRDTRLCDNDGRAAGTRAQRARQPGATLTIGGRNDARVTGIGTGRWEAALLLVRRPRRGRTDPTPAGAAAGRAGVGRTLLPGGPRRPEEEGLAAGAVQAYEAAVKEREAFPEAWNGLGFSLRQQGKYRRRRSRAYDRALKLRPDYAEALEYLGEAYVKMGKLDEARAVLGRLEPLDKKEAAELRAAIDKAKK